MEDLFTSLIIDVHKEIYEDIFDVPGAYLSNDMLEDMFILINIEDDCLGIMCEMNPEQKKNMRVYN